MRPGPRVEIGYLRTVKIGFPVAQVGCYSAGVILQLKMDHPETYYTTDHHRNYPWVLERFESSESSLSLSPAGRTGYLHTPSGDD
ncbi:MAG: hypothetical protein ACRD2L_00045 [Terriglobia bacterium]